MATSSAGGYRKNLYQSGDGLHSEDVNQLMKNSLSVLTPLSDDIETVVCRTGADLASVTESTIFRLTTKSTTHDVWDIAPEAIGPFYRAVPGALFAATGEFHAVPIGFSPMQLDVGALTVAAGDRLVPNSSGVPVQLHGGPLLVVSAKDANNIIYVVYSPTIHHAIGVVKADVEPGNTGTATIYDWTTTGVTTTEILFKYDWAHGGEKVSQDKKGFFIRQGGLWRLSHAECEGDVEPDTKIGFSDDTSLPAPTSSYTLYANRDGWHRKSGGVYTGLEEAPPP